MQWIRDLAAPHHVAEEQITDSISPSPAHASLNEASTIRPALILQPQVLINHFNHRCFCTPGINHLFNPFQPIVLPFKRKEGRGVFPVAGIPAGYLPVHNRRDMGLFR